jgi:hypothetical protein
MNVAVGWETRTMGRAPGVAELASAVGATAVGGVVFVAFPA